MRIIWGAVITLISGFGFLGQLICALWPETAQKLSLMERDSEVDSVFFADAKGEAAWDAIILWVLPLAGVLLIMGVPAWAYFGLTGGGMFLYFSGRGILVRILMNRQNIRIGSRQSLTEAFIFLTLWALIAILAIVLAVVDLA